MNLIKAADRLETQFIIEKYGRLDIEELKKPWKRFFIGALDRFDKQLNVEEADNLLLSYNYREPEHKQVHTKYFKQEKDYLDFFTYAFEMNNKNPIFVYSPDISSIGKYKVLKTFNAKDRRIIKDLIKNIQIKDGLYSVRVKDGLYKVESIDLLHIFAKLTLREVHFSNFFFEKSDSLIIGDYDMSLPLYCLNESTFLSYKKQASKLGLFIRTWDFPED